MLYMYACHATGHYELWEECYFGEENPCYLRSSVIVVITAVCIVTSEIVIFHISNNWTYITQWKCYFYDLFALLCTAIASIPLTNYIWYWKLCIYFCARLQTSFWILASVYSVPEYCSKINK